MGGGSATGTNPRTTVGFIALWGGKVGVVVVLCSVLIMMNRPDFSRFGLVMTLVLWWIGHGGNAGLSEELTQDTGEHFPFGSLS